MSGLGFDVRQLRHRLRDGFVWVGVLALAFGIGTSTAAFDLLNASLLRPLPVQDPDRLIGLYRSNEQREGHGPLSYPDYLDYRRRAQSLEDLAAYTQRPFVFAYEDQATRTWGGVVSQNYFDVLGLQAERGRLFLGDDKDAGSSVPVVLSYD
ncbi:MAG: ABC transporter permease, partial [Gemmatimonadota bacterium]